jgi:hypothetical protein
MWRQVVAGMEVVAEEEVPLSPEELELLAEGDGEELRNTYSGIHKREAYVTK